MKILHTSDWHLGRQLHHQNLLADQRHVLDKILEIVKREKVEVVLISGDIYDRSVPPADAVELLDDVLQKMNFDLQVPVVMIAGNHDGPERLSFGARQLARSGLHIVGGFETITSPVVLSDSHGEVAFYGIPYVQKNENSFIGLEKDHSLAESAETQAEKAAMVAEEERVEAESFIDEIDRLKRKHGEVEGLKTRVRRWGDVAEQVAEINKGVPTEKVIERHKSRIDETRHSMVEIQKKIREHESKVASLHLQIESRREDMGELRDLDQTGLQNELNHLGGLIQIKTKAQKNIPTQAEIDQNKGDHGKCQAEIVKAEKKERSIQLSLSGSETEHRLLEAEIDEKYRDPGLLDTELVLLERNQHRLSKRLDLAINSLGGCPRTRHLSKRPKICPILHVFSSNIANILLKSVKNGPKFWNLLSACQFSDSLLVALQKTGRMIGLISHVPELRERIEKRIDLVTSHCGSTAHLVTV